MKRVVVQRPSSIIKPFSPFRVVQTSRVSVIGCQPAFRSHPFHATKFYLQTEPQPAEPTPTPVEASSTLKPKKEKKEKKEKKPKQPRRKKTDHFDLFAPAPPPPGENAKTPHALHVPDYVKYMLDNLQESRNFEAWKPAPKPNIPPPESSEEYNKLLADLVKEWRFKDAETYFLEMKQRNFQTDITTWNTMMECLAQQGNTAEMERYKAEMKTFGIDMTTDTYNILIKGYNRKGGDFKTVMGIFDEMRSNGIQVTIQTFNSLIDCCGYHKEVAEMENILKRMQEEFNMQPDFGTWAAVMEAYMRSTRILNAIDMLYKIKDQGFQWTHKVCRAFLFLLDTHFFEGVRIGGQESETQRLRRELKKRLFGRDGIVPVTGEDEKDFETLIKLLKEKEIQRRQEAEARAKEQEEQRKAAESQATNAQTNISTENAANQVPSETQPAQTQPDSNVTSTPENSPTPDQPAATNQAQPTQEVASSSNQ